jgi:hypothetical protein
MTKCLDLEARDKEKKEKKNYARIIPGINYKCGIHGCIGEYG